MEMIRLKLLAFILLWECSICVVALNATNVTEPSLYSIEDNVRILYNDTLEIELYASNKCKLVQFINYFCGDCRRFAVTFKKIARKLYDWQRALTIYVVDCAQERNVHICRNFDIRQTPTLRLFPPHFLRSEQQIGLDIATIVPDEIYARTGAYIANIKYTSRAQPNFEPVVAMDNLYTLLDQVNCNFDAIIYIVLVYQPYRSTIGRDTILGLLPWPSVAVRIMSDRKLFNKFGFIGKVSDTLAIMDCVGNTLALHPHNDTSTAYIQSVSQYLQAAGYNPQTPLSAASNTSTTYKDEEQEAIISTVLQSKTRVYRADLEQAIDKLLHVELPKVRVFKGDSMLCLQQLLNVLHQFSPLNNAGNLLLERLYKFVSSTNELTGVAFQAQLQLLEHMLPQVFKARRYVGCIATRPFLRGFTCSLWTLFHYLTVQSAKSAVLPTGNVLGIIHGFVKHFFGCTDCVQHFVAMAERRKINSIESRDEEILWLWEAHNEINQRLAGDTTEDPKFPKLQFPSQNACEECKSAQNTTWRRSAVLSFLKDIYNSKNLSNYGLPTSIGYD